MPAWNTWKSWSDCTVVCNGGNQSRNRTCNDDLIDEEISNSNCESRGGNSEEDRQCGMDPCPSIIILKIKI